MMLKIRMIINKTAFIDKFVLLLYRVEICKIMKSPHLCDLNMVSFFVAN